MKFRAFLAAAIVPLMLGAAPAARAVDGCLVLLCLAGNWSAIAQCVAPVEELFRDLALGQPFPSCSFASAPSFPGSLPTNAAGAATQASGVRAPTYFTLEGLSQQNCPVQYAAQVFGSFSCSGYLGAVNVTVNGVTWSQTLWNPDGASVTCYSSAAESALGISNTPCDQAQAAYNARLVTTGSTGW